MRAILVDENKNLNWSEVPDPAPKANEIVIDIHAAALNRADLLQRAGSYPPPAGWPDWMGLEVAGLICQLGEGVEKEGKWKIGDKVCALLGGGGYAEKVAVDTQLVMPVPEGMSMTEAASIPEVFATAHLNLFYEGNLKAGETVLIVAGASGVGIAAIQLAKACGARVITTVSNAAKAEQVKQLGADIVVNRHEQSLLDVLKSCKENGQPVDVALDCAAGPQLGKHIEQLAEGGRWIIIATLAGTETELNIRPMLNGSTRLIASKLRTRSNQLKGEILTELAKNIWPKIVSGEMQTIIHSEVPIERAEEAHAILERQENIGKVVLKVK